MQLILPANQLMCINRGELGSHYLFETSLYDSTDWIYSRCVPEINSSIFSNGIIHNIKITNYDHNIC